MTVTTGGRATRSSSLALVLAELDVERLEQLAVLLLGGDDLDVVVQLGAEQLQRLVVDRLGGGDHLAEVEQHLDQRAPGWRRSCPRSRSGDAPRVSRTTWPLATRDLHAADRRGLHVVELLPPLLLRLPAPRRRAPAGTPEGALGAAAARGRRHPDAPGHRHRRPRLAGPPGPPPAPGAPPPVRGPAPTPPRAPPPPPPPGRVPAAATAGPAAAARTTGAAAARSPDRAAGRDGMFIGLGRGPPGRGPPGAGDRRTRRRRAAGPSLARRARGQPGRGPPGAPGPGGTGSAGATGSRALSGPGRRRRAHAGRGRAEGVVAWPRAGPRAHPAGARRDAAHPGAEHHWARATAARPAAPPGCSGAAAHRVLLGALGVLGRPGAAGPAGRGACGRAWPVPGPRKSAGVTGVRAGPGTCGALEMAGSPGPGRDAGDGATGGRSLAAPSAGPQRCLGRGRSPGAGPVRGNRLLRTARTHAGRTGRAVRRDSGRRRGAGLGRGGLAVALGGTVSLGDAGRRARPVAARGTRPRGLVVLGGSLLILRCFLVVPRCGGKRLLEPAYHRRLDRRGCRPHELAHFLELGP